MAISQVGTPVATNSTGSQSTSFTLNMPPATQANDLLLAVLEGNNSAQPPDQAGWTTISTVGTTTLCRGIYYRWATASEPSTYVMSSLTQARYVGAIAAYRGVDLTSPLDVAVPAASATASPASNSNLGMPAITPVTVGAWVIGIVTVVQADNTVPTFTSSNLTAVDVVEGSTGPSGNNIKGALGHFAWSSGSFTPQYSLTTGVAILREAGISIALRPASVTPPPAASPGTFMPYFL